ncbi:MAG TPA: FGGY-family carbohydrate kinase, partial [Pirellulales bacterium]
MEKDIGPVVLGVDLGTSGVRAMACGLAGQVVARVSVSLATGSPPLSSPSSNSPAPSLVTAAATPGAEVFREQSSEAWWQAVCAAVRQVIEQAEQRRRQPLELLGVCVDGTSGTVVALDAAGRPTRPAIMYNDARATAEAAELNNASGDHCARLGYRFDTSFALAKMLWIARREPDVWQRTTRLIHQADYIVGQLSGDFSTTDCSNALKTGYNLIDDRWPEWLSSFDGISARLPRVVAPGARLGEMSAAGFEATGISRGVPIFAGATDGVAACLASGLRDFGDYNATLGTTLVFKGMSPRIVRHP